MMKAAVNRKNDSVARKVHYRDFETVIDLDLVLAAFFTLISEPKTAFSHVATSALVIVSPTVIHQVVTD